MKKGIAMGLILVMGLALLGAAAAEELDAIYAYAQWYPEVAEDAGVSGEEAERVLSVDVGDEMRYLLLPEGSDPAGDYHLAGLRLTFDAPVAYERDGDRMLSLQLPEGILRPASVEIAGTMAYGEVVALSGDEITIEVWYETGSDGDGWKEGETASYAITPQTQQWCWETFGVGSGCTVVSDEDGTALMMIAGNG